MKALKPALSAALASSLLFGFGVLNYAAADTRPDDSAGTTHYTPTNIGPPRSASTGDLAGYLARVKKADEDCATTSLFGCSDVPAPTFGPAPSGGIDLQTLSPEDAHTAVTAYAVEHSHRHASPMSPDLMVFQATGHLPPTSGLVLYEDTRELWLKWIGIGVVDGLLLSFFAFAARRAFYVKGRFGVWPHDPAPVTVGRDRVFKPYFGLLFSFATFVFYISGNIYLQMFSVVFAFFSVIGASTGSGHYYNSTIKGEIARIRNEDNVAAMQNSTVQGSARLQGTNDLSGFVDEEEAQGGPPIF